MERGKVYLDLRDGCILSGNLIELLYFVKHGQG